MSENGNGHKVLAFDDFRLENDSQILWRNHAEVHLAKRPFQVLGFLAENNGRVVSRRELLDKFWDGREVYDDALRKCIGAIRKALDDEEKPPRYIETRYGGGYRFVADVQTYENNGNGLFNANNGRVSSAGDIRPPARNRTLVLIAFLIVTALNAIYFFLPQPRSATPLAALTDSTANIRSIAVMPIKNMTGDPANEYFSDGITESVITQLSRVRELRIISRTSTFIYKDKEVDPREVGRRLGVDALLEGGVQRIEGNVNIRVRLVSTKDGTVVWTSNDYERPITNAYDLQDLIACNVAAELRTELCAAQAVRGTTDGFAYQEYLKGRFEWNKRTGDGIKRSIAHYTKAIAFDPKYSLAYAGLADSYAQGIWHVPFDEKTALPKAKNAALQALELDESSAEAHTALASVMSHEWDWAGSERELERAIAIDPRYARAYHVQAFAYMIKGRYEDSVNSISRAEDLDPLNLVIQTDKGELLWTAGRVEEAFEVWRKTLEFDPNFVMALEHRALANEILGDDASAIDDYAAVMKIKGRRSQEVDDFRRTAAKIGMREFRRRELRNTLAARSRDQKLEPVWIAYLQAFAGQTNEAFRSLEAAYRDHTPKIVLMASPLFRKLSPDPRFDELMTRIGLR